MNMSGFYNLANAIVIRAIIDYRTALCGRKVGRKIPEEVIDECERFFRSEYFKVLTSVSGDYLILRIRNEARENRKVVRKCKNYFKQETDE